MSNTFGPAEQSGFIRRVGETNVLKGYQVEISGKKAKIQNYTTEKSIICSVKRIREYTNDDVKLSKAGLESQEHRPISLNKLISQLQSKRVAKK